MLIAIALAGNIGALQALPRWNPRAPENAQLMSAFTPAAVESVLDAIGARHQRSGTDPARPTMVVTFPNGRRAVVSLSSCDPRGISCKALGIQASWTKSATATPERTARAIEAFNQRYSFSKAYLTADGRPALQRYLTADYGFIRGNLAVNFLVFANHSERMAVEVLRPLEAPAR